MNRFKCFVHTSLLILLLQITISVKAQSPSVDSLITKAFKTDELLPLLITAAIKFSPQIQINNSSIWYASENVQIAKKVIFNTVSLFSNYNYGNINNSLNYQTLTQSGYNFTASKYDFYNVGINLQLPIGQLLTRKNYINASKALVNEGRAEKEKTTLGIKLEVIRLYQDMKLAHKLMDISSKNKQTLQITKAMAEKDFLNAGIALDQVSKIVESYSQSIIIFETYVNKFQTSYMLLEAFTGTNLSKLIMFVK